MWRPRTDQAGVEGDAKGGKIATLSRDLKKTLKKGPIRRAEGWSLDWEQVPDPNAAGEAQGSSTVAVSTHLVVGDETVVIGFKNGRAYTGVLQEGALVVCYEQASDFPRHCRMDWDGGVVSLYADDALLWTFRPKATAFDRAEFHVENGRALFREMLVIRLQLVD
jgi:hypothetical protein